MSLPIDWRRWPALIVLLLLLIGCSSPEPIAATVTYTPSDDLITNPERGFRYPAELDRYTSFDTFYTALGVTLVHAYVRLDDYRTGDLPPEFLENLAAGFANLPGSGVKVVLRFAYNFGPYPDSEPDASKEQILRHIQQLQPLLQQYGDSIAWLEAGFIGAWGEWHTSMNGLDNPTDKQEILFTLLDALPPSRMVQVRYPTDIIRIFPQPLNAAQAFDQSRQARVAFHNDCFLASATDMGTYERGGAITIERDQAYLAELSRFTPTGGETCAVNPPRTDCPTALRELALLHFSELNQSYHPNVIAGWQEQGCYPEIQRRLGYRLALTTARFNPEVRPGGVISLTVQLENSGFAAPINPRPLYLVLAPAGADGDRGSEVGSAVRLPVDPRRWEPGAATVTVRVQVPSRASPGAYNLALWLPDAAAPLAANPRYAIRFANEQVWQASTGYNVLGTVVVTDDAGGAAAWWAADLAVIP